MIPLVWFTYLCLMMEFAPLRISAYYQPIHRLVRFLSIISIPTLLVVASFLKQVYRERGAGKALALLLMAGLVVTSLHQTYRKSYCYRDSMADARSAFAILQHMPYRRIISDHELKMALLLYNQYEHGDAFKSFEYDKPQFLNGSLVILGGARWPDIHHLYADNFARSTRPQINWVKICEVEGEKEAWRKSNLVMYRIVAKDTITDEGK